MKIRADEQTSIWVTLCAFAVLAPACSSTPSDDDGNDAGPAPGSYEAVLGVVTESCATGSSCHGGTDGQARLSFTPAVRGQADLRDVLLSVPSCEYDRMPRIDPFRPDNSWLYLKLVGSHDEFGAIQFEPDPNWDPGITRGTDGKYPLSVCPLTQEGEIIFGSLMPFAATATPLPDAQIAVFREWIARGAPGSVGPKPVDGGGDGAVGGPCQPGGELEVQVGVPDPSNPRAFVSLLPGGDIPMVGGGQAGRSITVALRTRNFVGEVAMVSVTITRTDTGDSTTRAGDGFSQFICLDDDNRYLVPIVMNPAELGGADLDGVEARVEAIVTDQSNNEASATGMGVLRIR